MSPPTTYASVHRNVALLLGGLLLLLAAFFGGIALAMHVAANGDELLPLMLWLIGGFVAGFLVLVLSCLRRHRWTLTATRGGDRGAAVAARHRSFAAGRGGVR